MVRGSTGYDNLTITIAFYVGDGADNGCLESIREEWRPMDDVDAINFFYELPAETRARLRAECWEDACLSEQEAS